MEGTKGAVIPFSVGAIGARLDSTSHDPYCTPRNRAVAEPPPTRDPAWRHLVIRIAKDDRRSP
jgi:hypothetical protein